MKLFLAMIHMYIPMCKERFGLAREKEVIQKENPTKRKKKKKKPGGGVA